MLSTVTGLVAAIIAAISLVATYFFWISQRIARDAERLVPPCGNYVTVEGCRIHYLEQGQGRPIVMIHGLGGTLHHMRRPLMEELAKTMAAGEEYRLIALDRPGSGYSTRPRACNGSLSEQARFIAGFIDTLGLERPLLVGHSLGGAVALATALDYPDKLSGLALIAPLTHYQQEIAPQFRPLLIHSPLLRRIVSATLAIPASIKASPQTLDFVFGPQKPPRDFAIQGGAMAGMRPSHFYATSTDLVALQHDLQRMEGRYQEISLPTGIIFGSADRVLDYRDHGLAMETKIAGVDIEIAAGSGHMLQYADTPRVAAFIHHIAKRAFTT